MANSLSHLVRAATSHHQDSDVEFGMPELIRPMLAPCQPPLRGRRVNLVLPVILDRLSYGGVATALRFFERLAAEFDCARIILLNQTESEFDFNRWPDWVIDRGCAAHRSIAFLGDEATTLSISDKDFFLATFWTTAVYIRDAVAGQARLFPETAHRFVYLIQDYEAAFYPWSDRHEYAKSTYREREGVIGVFNSKLLADYFWDNGFKYARKHVYEPILHPRLRSEKTDSGGACKERLILVYGRPSMPRNCFDLVVEALKAWALTYPSAVEWTVISAGEKHADLSLTQELTLRSLGKMTLDEYASHLSRCWIGLSFMLSPHPSYPPLEMAEFGAWVITNSFANKNLSTLSSNIISVDQLAPETIAAKLAWCCDQYEPGRTAVIESLGTVFSEEQNEFPFVPALMESWQ